MKKIIAILVLGFLISCNNDPKKEINQNIDTTVKRKTPPPDGLGVVQDEPQIRSMARAIEDISILKNGDTLVLTTETKSVPYTTVVKTIRPFKGGQVNQSPTVNAGSDQVIKLPTNAVTLSGIGTDVDGTVAGYSWSKISGPAGSTFNPVNAAKTTVQNLAQGVHSFKLTVTDNKGAIAADDISVTVNAITPPTPAGKYLSLPTSSGKTINGQNNVVIENLQFKDIQGNGISIGGGSTNITIRNCFFNKGTEEAIEIENASNITIENCLFNGVTTGVYALSASTIKINNNQFVNVRMRIINGGEAGRGQFVQFNGVGGEGNEIMNNKGENFLGESNPEDMISIFNSSGTATSPIKISGNMFRGGGPSSSGGGIIAGDNGGGWVIMENNTLLNPGQYGMAIAGGHDIIIRNNKVFANRSAFSNNPLYVWKQSDPACTNHTVTGNFVTWIDKDGANNKGWNAGNCTNTTYNPNDNKPITLAEMNVPVHLIDKITPAELLTIRK